jgi:DNA-binding transcriptional MocR family regulator
VDHFDPRFTADKLAAEHGVSSATVKRAGKLAAEHGVSKATVQPRNDNGTMADKPVVPQHVGIPENAGPKNKSAEAKAAASKTNRGTVERICHRLLCVARMIARSEAAP